ncbi:FTR1 family protein [Salmonella enterica]|nr:FTR1 family protein [Salmonella enterica]EMD3917943.1 FTR1 family protein [Salmonella enterica]
MTTLIVIRTVTVKVCHILLATFIIALREGLEAALIVGIIAAFLRKNNKSLKAMWGGVSLAVLLSVVTGVALDITEHALPQSAQEGMEAIIGLVAVFFVTGMIVWMNTHAHSMKKQLEAEVTDALGQSGEWALASMAFLAVLKEGFETSVFLLATFSVIQSAVWAVTGAITGLIVAVVIGWGIYVGGLRINLSRFFRFTGLFLVLIAAGLVVSAMRSAHEAGWVNIGQERIADLHGLISPGTISSALISGVLGIPADPRTVEVICWSGYILIAVVMLCWPANLRPSPKATVRILLCSSAISLLIAFSLFFLPPVSRIQMPEAIPLVNTAKPVSSPSGYLRLIRYGKEYQLYLTFENRNEAVRVSIPTDEKQTYVVHGAEVSGWIIRKPVNTKSLPDAVTLEQVIKLYGRIPVGLNPSRHPGPFKSEWTGYCIIQAEMADGAIISAVSHPEIQVSLSGGGLITPRSLNVTAEKFAPDCHWKIRDDYQRKAMQELQFMKQSRDDRYFLRHHFLLMLLALSLILFFMALKVSFKIKRKLR